MMITMRIFIGVRRLIKALENDGIACETKHRQRFMKMRFAASQNLACKYAMRTISTGLH